MQLGIKAIDNSGCSKQQVILSQFTYVIYTPLTDVQAPPFNALYEAFISQSTSIPYQRVWTITPNELSSIVTPSNFCLSVDGVAYVINAVTVLTAPWFTMTDTDIVIQTNDEAMIGIYNFELSWNWNDGVAYNQDKVFTFAVDVKNKV
jgi:hypothetical protein